MESVTLTYVSPKFYKIPRKKTFSQNYNKNLKGKCWDLYTVSHICWNKKNHNNMSPLKFILIW